MLDHRLVLEDPEKVSRGLQRRGEAPATVDNLHRLADERRQAIQHVESLRQQLNTASAEVQQKARAKDHAAVEAARTQLKGLKEELKAAEEAQAAAEQSLNELLLRVPNLPQDDVPDGPDEGHNVQVRDVGNKPAFDFEPAPHWDIAQSLGIVNFEQAGKLSGARFAVYHGAGARLERALCNFMLDVAQENGYQEVGVPLLVRPETMIGAAQFPKFQGDAFETLDHEYALIPTSEVPLVMLHQDDIVEEAVLPLRYTAYTPCFRREAGAAGRDTRGLIRQHQFHKVELVAFTTPEQSNAELERLTSNAEEILKRLELPYRVMQLCAGDMGFASSKTYDLEVWLPGQGAYREISSCSNCWDFQARRAQIRYRPQPAAGQKGKNKPRLLHTLNGSGLAVGRAFVALLENFQQADGSVRIPAALVPYFGAERIGALA